VVLAFLVAVTGLLALDADQRVALYVAPVWFALLGVGYASMRASQRAQR
jgi:L-asparagine transporter-like permease